MLGHDGAADPGFGVYIHWPFCLSKCPYCDFNSHVAEGIEQGRWRQALLRELDHFARQTPGREATSIFFGGGTPSLMEPATVAALIEAVRGAWPVARDLEITLEANPSSVEAASFAAFRDAGVNRVSLGVQSLDEAALAFLGRRHSAAEAKKAVEIAAAIFPRYSFDLIYARPGQTLPSWRNELCQALEMADGHVSLYQLTIEPGTPFHRNRVEAADEEAGARLYEATQALLESAGLPPYEISNHARPGEECRHNLVYWRGGDYVGVGPGAHGRLTHDGVTWAVHQVYAPARWLEGVEANGHATQKRTVLSPEARRQEILMGGLRMSEGIGRARFRRLTGSELEDAIDAENAQRLIAGGFLVLDDDGVRATASGRLRLNAVLARLLG